MCSPRDPESEQSGHRHGSPLPACRLAGQPGGHAGHQRFPAAIQLVLRPPRTSSPPLTSDAGQARAAGYATIEDLLAGLHGSPTLPLYRVRFRQARRTDGCSVGLVVVCHLE